MNKKRLLQQYDFIIKKYNYSDKTYLNTYHKKDDLYVFLNEFDNMNVFSMYPEMIIYKLQSMYDTNITDIISEDTSEEKLKDFMYRSSKMKNIYIKIKNKFDEFEGEGEAKTKMKEYALLKKKYENQLINKYFHYHILDFLRLKLGTQTITNAWLKCYELLYKFDLIEKENTDILKTFHICELPGAFIMATQYYVKHWTKRKLAWTAQSLNPYNEENRRIRKGMFLPDKYKMAKNNPDKYDWADGTGDITNIKNIKYYIKKYGKSRDLVTSDCGQDSSEDFVGQEIRLNKVYWGQFVCAIGLLKKGGNYFAKLFSIQTIKMIEFVYLCTVLFEQVYITKPLKTKLVSGEIYLVCKNFLDKDTDEYLDKFYTYIENFDTRNLVNLDKIDDDFIDELDMCNNLMGQRRITNINKLIYLINNIEFYVQNPKIKNHIDKMVEYYVRYFCEYYEIGI